MDLMREWSYAPQRRLSPTKELPPSFFENSTPDLDCSIRLSLTEDPNSQQNSRRNSEEYLDMNSPYHPPTAHRPTEKPKGSIKKSKLTSGYFADQIPLNGLNKYPWQNSSITSDPTQPPANLCSISSWDMNHKHSPTSLTRQTSPP